MAINSLTSSPGGEGLIAGPTGLEGPQGEAYAGVITAFGGDLIASDDVAAAQSLLQITAVVIAFFQSLPTTLPNQPNVPWNNGGSISLS